MKEYRRKGGRLFLCQKSPLTTICFFCDFYQLSSSYSDELVIFLFSFFFFSSKDVYAGAFCVDVAMPLLCDALFLLITLTDSGTQSVNNKDRRQKPINEKLIYYKYCIVLYNHIKAIEECSNGSYITQFLHKFVHVIVFGNIVFLHISTPSVNNKERR